MVLDTGALSIGGGNVSSAAEDADRGVPTDVMTELYGGMSTGSGGLAPAAAASCMRGCRVVVVVVVLLLLLLLGARVTATPVMVDVRYCVLVVGLGGSCELTARVVHILSTGLNQTVSRMRMVSTTIGKGGSGGNDASATVVTVVDQTMRGNVVWAMSLSLFCSAATASPWLRAAARAAVAVAARRRSMLFFMASEIQYITPLLLRAFSLLRTGKDYSDWCLVVIETIDQLRVTIHCVSVLKEGEKDVTEQSSEHSGNYLQVFV